MLHIPQEITLMHVLLAYLGLAIHILSKLKLAFAYPDFTWAKFTRKNIISVVASFLMIPVILVLLCEPAIKATLPLNNITAMLAGYQTNSIFKMLMSFYPKNKSKSSDDSDIANDSGESDSDDIG